MTQSCLANKRTITRSIALSLAKIVQHRLNKIPDQQLFQTLPFNLKFFWQMKCDCLSTTTP